MTAILFSNLTLVDASEVNWLGKLVNLLQLLTKLTYVLNFAGNMGKVSHARQELLGARRKSPRLTRGTTPQK